VQEHHGKGALREAVRQQTGAAAATSGRVHGPAWRPETVLPAFAVLLLVAAAVLAAASLLLRSVQPSATSNELLFDNGPTALIDASNSPTVVRNPTDPANLVVVNKVDRPQYSAVVHWTRDGGRTWGLAELPLPAGRDRPYAPDAAFAPDGTLYVSYVNLQGAGNDPQTLWLARSGDGGQSFAPPTAVAGHYAFQPRIAVGHTAIYLTWLQGTNVGVLTMVGPASIVMARSTDGGETFSAPVPVSDASRQRVGAAVPLVTSDRQVDVLYEDFKNDVRDFLNLDGPAWPRPFALVFTSSIDGGRSFSPGVEVDGGLSPSERFLVYLPRFPSIAAGPGGSLYASWADARSGADHVFIRRSRDGGKTWGARVRVQGQPEGPGISDWLPAVAVGGDGRVDVLFLGGHRDVADGLVNAYLASSDDQATTFHTSVVSTQGFDSRIGPLTGPSYLPPDMGSRLGLVSDAHGSVGVWTDTRQGSANSGRQDIGLARMVMTQVPVSSGRWLLIGGMVLVAALLAAAWFVRLWRADFQLSRPVHG
jgi:hypothetical protein